jgi:hypothetical protein
MIFDSNLIMPIYKLKKILQKAPNDNFRMNKRKQKLVNLRLIINMENIAYLEFFVTADAKADSSTIMFSSRQTLPATYEFQGILPIECVVNENWVNICKKNGILNNLIFIFRNKRLIYYQKGVRINKVSYRIQIIQIPQTTRYS